MGSIWVCGGRVFMTNVSSHKYQGNPACLKQRKGSEKAGEVGKFGAVGWGRRQGSWYDRKEGKSVSTYWRNSDWILQVIRNH